MSVGEWDHRQLCPDGACVGVIGPAGTCKVCGHVAPNWGDERNRGLTPLPPDAPSDDDGDRDTTYTADHEAPDEDDDDADAADESADEADEPASLGDPPGWDDRTLCSDDACIGVIGPDGTCKTCGKPA